jgi:hypothetical protein
MLIAENVFYQFKRKAPESAQIQRDEADKVARIAVAEAQRTMNSTKNAADSALAPTAYQMVRDMLSTMEFLAREARGSETPERSLRRKEAVNG